MENKGKEIDSLKGSSNNYKTILKEIEALTARIHREVDRVLADYKRDTEKYHRRMKTKSGMTSYVPPTTLASRLARPRYTEEELKDGLVNYDYSRLEIPLRQTVEGLEIRSQPLNTIGGPQGRYTIDGKIFSRQNVRGTNMRCYFNSVGLVAEEEIKKLKANRNDPAVRYMITNEIVSAAANPDQLPQSVKSAINYDLYRQQRAELNELDERRSKWLRDNGEGNLPEGLRRTVLDEQDRQIKEDLRTRAASLKAFYAFLDDHIGTGEMMVSLHAVKGEAGDNTNADYTSIDGTAYKNNFGIKIYQPNEGCKLYFMSNDAPVSAPHTPALRKIGDDDYRLFVRTKEGFVSEALDPTQLGIDVKDFSLQDKKSKN